VADINGEAAKRVASEIKGSGGTAEFCVVDVSQSSDMIQMTDQCLKHFCKIDVMVNNAGMSHPNQPLLEIEEHFFDRIYEVNVKSIYLSAIHCIPVFRQQGSGCFINIGSTAAVRPRPGLSWYNGSKGAVTLLTKSLAIELAPENIRANSINPAIGETPLLKTFMGKDDTPENRKAFLSTIPMGRLCQPADVSNAAVFLAEPSSEYITGVSLEVDGGRCI